jgi:putative transposase
MQHNRIIDSYANAIAERINGILKSEFIGYDNKLDIKIMEQLIKNSIQIYNDSKTSLFNLLQHTK